MRLLSPSDKHYLVGFFHPLRWGDNGASGRFDGSFNVNQTGTYNYLFQYYVQNASLTGTVEIYVNGITY